MRATRVLAIIAILGIAFSFRASANVVYDSETTNTWFRVNMSTLKAEDLKKSPWTPPHEGGEATVVNQVIKLDTDLDDPLMYTATDNSAAVAIVAAEMTATVNASVPELKDVPQAALCVIGTASATNWVGLVGDGSGGTNWVTFPAPTPVAGETYSVRIEFDQRQEQRKIRYRIGDTVLGDGWYPNPQKTAAANIQSVSFSGTGDIKALDGENITENTIAFKGLAENQGFDFTNGGIRVSADIQGYKSVTAELKLVDFGTGEEHVIGSAQSLDGEASWSLSALIAGGTYAYTIEAKDAGGNVIATKTGTFTAANWPANIWFGADASKAEGSRETGGSWDSTKKPAAVEDNAYVIEDDALFNVTDQKPGSNHVTRVDTVVTFETLVDSSALEIPEDVALGGFVAAKSDENPQWMALTADNSEPVWVVLTGDITPTVNKEYVIRAEVDFISDKKCVRFLVSDDDGATFLPLSGATSQWINLATQEKYSLAAVELKGSGRVAKFEAMVADKALAVVDGVEYDSMDEAFEAAGTNGEHVITLLTNATVDPKKPGSYDIVPDGHHYASGGQVSTDTTTKKTIVIDDSGEPKVRPSTEEMNKVKTPDDKSYKDINSLRAFLERNGVEAYTDNGSSTDIKKALDKVPDDSNGLKLWEDYVMGIEPEDPVDPVTTPAGDADANNITLAIPAIDTSKYSGDYSIGYQVMKGAEAAGVPSDNPGAILIPLTGNCTGTYTIKAVFTPTPALEQAK